MGQLMEYAYYYGDRKADKLIIVAEQKPSKMEIAYLKHIREKYQFPLFYQSFDKKKQILSSEY